MNYLALLGWSLDGTTEIFSRDDLLEKFTLERVNPSPGTFDYNKLRWFNQHYINHILTPRRSDPARDAVPGGGGIDRARAHSHPITPISRACAPAIALLKDRIETLAEAPDLMSYFLQPELEPYDAALLVPKKMTREETLAALEAVARPLAGDRPRRRGGDRGALPRPGRRSWD